MPDPESFKKAKAHALRYLSYRDRSKWELSQYLGKKEHSPSVIQKTLDYLTELNYVDDQRFALQWGQYKINKNKIGKNRLYMELLGKGVNKETIEGILSTLYEENPDSLPKDEYELVHKEVAARIVSEPQSKIYGRLSVSMQARCHVESVLDVKPNAFYPIPKVMSSLLKIIPKSPLDKQIDTQLNQILTLAFNQRRKKIRNSLKDIFTPDEMRNLEIDPELRPENLTVKEFLRLSAAGINR